MQTVSIPFTAHGKDYVVRLGTDETAATIRVFDKATGQPVNGYVYHLDEQTPAGLEDITSRDVVEALAHVAMQDVVKHRWEHFLRRVSKAKGVPGVPPAKLA